MIDFNSIFHESGRLNELFPPWLEGLWERRNLGSPGEAEQEFRVASAKFGLRGPGLEGDLEILTRLGASPESALDFLLLEVSFARRARDFARAEKLLESHWALALSLGIRAGFNMHYQAAINALVLNDYSRALLGFEQAKSLAPKPILHAYADFNCILCKENLAVPIERDLALFGEAHGALLLEERVTDLKAQYFAALVRERLRSLNAAALNGMMGEPLPGGQAGYHLAWLASLPSFNFPQGETARKAGLSALAAHAAGYQASFMLGTLTGVVNQGDYDRAQRSVDLIERLYLWVWRWLINPADSGLKPIFDILECIQRQTWTVLPTEEFLMLECAVRWIGFFLRVDSTQVFSFLRRYDHPTTQSSLPFDYERAVLDALCGGPSHLRSFKALRNPAGPGDFFVLPALVEALAASLEAQPFPKLFEVLGESIRSVLAPAKLDVPSLSVDNLAASLTVRRADGEKRVVSEPLVALLNLFASAQSASVVYAVKACFGVGRYEPSIHDNRLAKLLTQANGVLKDLAHVKRRGSRLYFEGGTCPLQWAGSDRHTAGLSAHEARAFHAIFPGRQVQEDASRSSQPSVGAWLSRDEVQKLLKRGKTQTLVQLQKWLRDGLIQRSGVGKKKIAATDSTANSSRH